MLVFVDLGKCAYNIYLYANIYHSEPNDWIRWILSIQRQTLHIYTYIYMSVRMHFDYFQIIVCNHWKCVVDVYCPWLFPYQNLSLNQSLALNAWNIFRIDWKSFVVSNTKLCSPLSKETKNIIIRSGGSMSVMSKPICVLSHWYMNVLLDMLSINWKLALKAPQITEEMSRHERVLSKYTKPGKTIIVYFFSKTILRFYIESRVNLTWMLQNCVLDVTYFIGRERER